MFRIGVISDTHIPRRKQMPGIVLEALKDVDLIIHAGDILDFSVIEMLLKIAPVEAVTGNIDSDEIRKKLDRKKILNINGVSIGLVHGDEGKGQSTPMRAFSIFEQDHLDCIIFGHSHIPFKQVKDGILLFNPGSPTDPRRQPLPSFGIIEINGQLNSKIVYIDGDKLI